jgi:hypothetical protein
MCLHGSAIFLYPQMYVPPQMHLAQVRVENNTILDSLPNSITSADQTLQA